MTTVTINLPDGVPASLPRSTAGPGEFVSTPEEFASEIRLAAAIHWYHRGDVSGSKAAEIAGMTRLEFLETLARLKLDVIVVDQDELRRELVRG